MGYANTIQALTKNVDEDDKKKLEELGGPKMGPPKSSNSVKMEELGNPCEGLPDANARKTMFINESGLWSLIPTSEKPEANPLDPGLKGSWAMPTRSKKFG